MSLFHRKPKKAKVAIPPKSSALGLLHMEWERQRMPSPGAMNYAYETLGLVPHTAIGPAVVARQNFEPISNAPQPFFHKAVQLDGLPTVSGQIMSAPLYNPETGSFHSSPHPMMNSPFAHPEIAAAGYAL